MSTKQNDVAGATGFLRSAVLLPDYFVGLGAFCIIGFYVAWLGLRHGLKLSTDPTDWGTFGDYVGGILNPVCAYMAFIWLVRSYALQKTELEETRKTLKESHQAQLLQAKISYATARVETANIRINLLTTQAGYYRSRLKDLERQSTEWVIGRRGIGTNPFADAIENTRAKLSAIIADHDNQVARIVAIEENLTKYWLVD